MAHFAQVDENNIVVNVVVVPDEQEQRGQDFLANELGLGGRWIQTSYNGSFRKQFAGIGFSYDSIEDVFIIPKPHNSWTLDADHNWVAPIAKPDDDCFWNEENLSWEK